jgi:hypothetical protein
VRERLAYCLQYHGDCRLPWISEAGVRPLRLLKLGLASSCDAQNPSSSSNLGYISLIQSNPNDTQPYTTLSYVWGEDQSSKTTKANLVRHETSILLSTLPKTIRDAVQVTRQIGVAFLWVDSLCIVQDDPEEVAQEVANMAPYYANSILTISAAAANNCQEGFLHRPDPDKAVPNVNENFDLPFRSEESPRGSIMLRTPRLPCREAIDFRAWTLQEGLLATRLV